MTSSLNSQPAKTLDEAWLNFEPDVPLPSKPDGEPHPFYVKHPQDPLRRLKRDLIRSATSTSKHFFSGHRGCGKSTQLLRLQADPEINQRFFPVFFEIQDHVDISDVDFRDILLIIGSQMFLQFDESEQGKIPEQLLEELDLWRGQVEERLTTVKQGRFSGDVGVQVGGNVGVPSVSLFFGRLNGTLKIEPKVRHELRQILEWDITKLIDILNLIASTISAKTKKSPLILIDGLDKIDLKFAKEIFHERLQIMRQPAFSIIYTVSSALFYTRECMALQGSTFFVPNIKLYDQADSKKQPDKEGYRMLSELLNLRMERELFTAKARHELIKMSGGVFRELGHLVQFAADNAIERDAKQIEEEDVVYATAELRNPYWGVITAEDRKLLRQVRRTRAMNHPDQLADLLQILAILEYRNGDRWCDVHPVLEHLLDRLEIHDDD